MPTVHQRHRQTDGQTDGRLTIAIPRFALRASRGKNDDNNNDNCTLRQRRRALRLSEEFRKTATKTVVTCKIKHLQNICKNVIVFYFTCTHPKTFAKDLQKCFRGGYI